MRKLKMSNRSKVALDETLKKWKAIGRGDKKALLISCHLCKLAPSCNCCPVKIKTGEAGCRNTPFWEFNSDHRNYKSQARKEVKFLESCYY